MCQVLNFFYQYLFKQSIFFKQILFLGSLNHIALFVIFSNINDLSNGCVKIFS